MALLVKTPAQLAVAFNEGRVVNTVWSGAGTVIYALVVNPSLATHATELWSVTH